MKKIIVNALIIMVSSLVLNTAGISFRVFLSNKIGTEGIGLFQLIFSVYLMAILFVVTGINVAVTRLIAEEGGRNSFSIARALLVKAFSISFLFSIPAFLLLFFGADHIGSQWLGDHRMILPLKLLAVGLPFAGVSACIKGYFYAVGKLIRPSSSQAVELVIQIAITVSILDYFIQGGPEYACAAAALGITTAEMASCIYNLTLYRYEVEKHESRISEIFHQRKVMNRLLHISFPVSVSSLVRSGLRMLENIMIPIGFQKYGYTKKLSLEEYGRIQGMAIPVLMFPSTVILAFSALLIPEISEANALNQKKRVEYSVTRSLQLTCIMSILISGLFVFYSDKLGLAIYGSEECGSLMRVLAPLIPLIYLDIVVDELLKGLNQQVSALKYNIIDAVIRIILIIYALPLKGLAGLIFVLYICGLINIAFSMRKLLKVTKLALKVRDWILKPILSVTASGFTTFFLLDLAGHGLFNDIVYIVISSVIVGVLYFIFLTMLGCLTKDDFRWFRNIFRFSLNK